MFSRDEAKKIRQEFWTSFGKSFPRKWILYNTGIKDFSFKFFFDTKKALVALDIEDSNLENRIFYYKKILSLQSILKETYLSRVQFEDAYMLDNGKEITRIYTQLDDVSIHNKTTWQHTMLFFNKDMSKFEDFFKEYADYIRAK